MMNNDPQEEPCILAEIREKIKQREADPNWKPPVNQFHVNSLVMGVVTNNNKDDFATIKHKEDLDKLVGKDHADQLVQKGLKNQRQKQKITKDLPYEYKP